MQAISDIHIKMAEKHGSAIDIMTNEYKKKTSQTMRMTLAKIAECSFSGSVRQVLLKQEYIECSKRFKEQLLLTYKTMKEEIGERALKRVQEGDIEEALRVNDFKSDLLLKTILTQYSVRIGKPPEFPELETTFNALRESHVVYLTCI